MPGTFKSGTGFSFLHPGAYYLRLELLKFRPQSPRSEPWHCKGPKLMGLEILAAAKLNAEIWGES